MYVLHHCDNPSCVNPDHLFLGTYQDNAIDAEQKGRLYHPVGEAHWWSKLKANDVRFIRNSSLSSRKLAKLFGIGKSQVLRIKHNTTWRHITV